MRLRNEEPQDGLEDRVPGKVEGVMVYPERIEELPNNGITVLLMRRTTNNTVKTSVGYRDAFCRIQGWYGSRPPTHFIGLPYFPSRRPTMTETDLRRPHEG